LATVRIDGDTRAARIDGEQATLLDFHEIGNLLGGTPPVFLEAGQTVTSAIEGLGAMSNLCLPEVSGSP